MIKQSILTLTTLSLFSAYSLGIDLTACVGCHGQNFEKPAMNLSQIVKDLNKTEIRIALQGYKEGSKGGSMQEVMTQQISKFTDSQLDEIVEIISNNMIKDSIEQDSNETKVSTPIVSMSSIDSCIGCHGEYFEKSAFGYSRVVNQMSKEDIIASMNGYKDGSYGGDRKALMATQAMKFSTQEIEALANMIGK